MGCCLGDASDEKFESIRHDADALASPALAA